MEDLKQIIDDCLLLEELTPEAFSLVYEKAKEDGVPAKQVFYLLEQGFLKFSDGSSVSPNPAFQRTLTKYAEDQEIKPNEYAFLRQLAQKFSLSDFHLISFVRQALMPDPGHAVEAVSLESEFIPQEGAVLPPEPEPETEAASVVFTEVETLSEHGPHFLLQKGKLEGKAVVIKRLRPEFRGDPIFQALLRQEFQTLSTLKHENLVKVLSQGKDPEGAFLAMEFLEGKTIREMMTDNGFAQKGELGKVVQGMLEGLKFLHSQNVFHRDLKPGNIMILPEVKVKLLDLGLALDKRRQQIPAKAAGTRKYMAPELHKNPDQANAKSDIFSFGVILLEMLIGPLESKVQLGMPKEWEQIVAKCIKKNPEERFSSAGEVLNALKGKSGSPEKKAAKQKPAHNVKPPIPPIDMDKEYLRGLHKDSYFDLYNLNIPVPFHPENLKKESIRLAEVMQTPALSFDERKGIKKRMKLCFDRWEKFAYHYPEYRSDFVEVWNQSQEERKVAYLAPAYFTSSIMKKKYS